MKKRSDPGYKEFCRMVRKRDKGRCQMPGCYKRRKTYVHHIRPYAKCRHLRVDPDNGILLCYEHHLNVSGKEAQFAPLFTTIVWQNK